MSEVCGTAKAVDPAKTQATIDEIIRRCQEPDKPLRHIVERLTPRGVVPPEYSSTALCGEKVTEVVLDHGEICQGCVDETRRRPVER